MAKHLNTNYIIIGVAIAVLIGIIIWMMMRKKEGPYAPMPPLHPEHQGNIAPTPTPIPSPPPSPYGPSPSPSPMPPPSPSPYGPSPSPKPEGFQHGKRPTLVLFYANGCGHCANMMGDWEKVSSALVNSPVQALKFEASQDPKALQAAGGIRGFPTVRLYIDGFPGNNVVEYNGDRSAGSLMRFAQSGGQSV